MAIVSIRAVTQIAGDFKPIKRFTRRYIRNVNGTLFSSALLRSSSSAEAKNKQTNWKTNKRYLYEWFFFYFILILIRFIWRQRARHRMGGKAAVLYIWWEQIWSIPFCCCCGSLSPTSGSRCLLRFVTSVWWLVKRKHIMHVFVHIWSAYLCSCVNMLKTFRNHLNLECWSRSLILSRNHLTAPLRGTHQIYGGFPMFSRKNFMEFALNYSQTEPILETS